MQYRRDIDGLRAVAVLPVILFHAGIAGFGGGFLGVDVFFVISGYLITGILTEDHNRGGISILRFYERRARRILPALFVVLAVSAVVGAFWMHPHAYRDFMSSLGLTAVFVSNLYFMTRTGYFADSAALQPLLHTWSLAVEEQFYLLYPLLLLVLLRARRAVVLACLGGLLLASIGFALWAQGAYPEENFFFPLSRAWQLLAGAMVARLAPPLVAKPALAAAGLGLIVLSMALEGAGQTWAFPSPWAFGTVAGTALLLRHGAAGGVATALLSSRVLVGIGLVSYGAYLWHQPLFVFARVRMMQEPSLPVMLGLSALAVGLGALTWALVETPVRRGTFRLLATRRAVFTAAGVISAGFFGLGLAGYTTNGFPGRVSAEVAHLSNITQYAPWPGSCFGQQAMEHPDPTCGTIKPQHNVMLIGDSHAVALSGETMAGLDAAGYGSYIAAFPGCPSLPGLYAPADSNPGCEAFARAAIGFAATLPDATVVLAIRWVYYVDGTVFDNGEGGVERGKGGGAELWSRRDHPSAPLDPDRAARVLQQMVLQIKDIASRQPLILVYPIPEAGWNVPDRLAQLRMFGGDPDRLTTSHARYIDRQGAVMAALDAIDSPNLFRVRPDRLLCDVSASGRCRNTVGAEPLYADDDHLARPGAALVAAEILRQMQAIDARKAGADLDRQSGALLPSPALP